MLGKDKKEEKINVKKLNEVIKLSRNILNIMYILGIIALIILTTYLLKDWGIFKMIYSIFSILLPLFIGILIAWLLDPIVSWLQKKGVNRNLSVVCVFVVFVATIILVMYLFIPSLASQVQDVVGVIPSLAKNVEDWIVGFFDNLSNLYNYDFTSMKDQIFAAFNDIADTITVGLPNLVVNIASSIISGGITFLFSLILAFYMLFDFNNVRKHIVNLLPKRIHVDAIELTDRLNHVFRSYVQGILLDTFILFTFQSIMFSLVGLKAPLVFGLICAVTNIIPYIGPYIGGAPAVLVGFTISPMVGVLTFGAVMLSQLLESYALNPIIMSKTMKLHPVTIIVGLLIFGNFFGMIGMILSTPTISALKTIFNFFEEKFEIFEKLKN